MNYAFVIISLRIVLKLSVNESECVANVRLSWWISICDDCCFITSANAVSYWLLVDRTKWLRLKTRKLNKINFWLNYFYFSILTFPIGWYKSLVKSQYLM